MKTYKPTSKSRRSMTTVTYRGVLTGDKPLKSLLSTRKRRAGRNNAGRITVRHQGGGHKRRFRDIDFTYDKKDIRPASRPSSTTLTRTAFIARAVYADGERRYVLASKDMKKGDTFIVGGDRAYPERQPPSAGQIAIRHLHLQHRAQAGSRRAPRAFRRQLCRSRGA